MVEPLTQDELASITSGKWKLRGKYPSKIVFGDRTITVQSAWNTEMSMRDMRLMVKAIMPEGYDTSKLSDKVVAKIVSDRIHAELSGHEVS